MPAYEGDAPPEGAPPEGAAKGPEKTYFDYLAAGDWRIPHCTACCRAVFQPRVRCPACGGDRFLWQRPSGMGTIYSTTTMRRAAAQGGDLNLCLVDLDEGVRMMSRVVDAGSVAPRIGDRLRATLQRENDTNLVVFERVEAA